MKTQERITWILDSANPKLRFDEGIQKKNIDFVHSLGLKCDCVGWCDFDLTSAGATGVLQNIEDFAKKNRLIVRGMYQKKLSDFDSQWYYLQAKSLTGDFIDYEEYIDQYGNQQSHQSIMAYKIPKHTPLLSSSPLPIVSESFRNACIEHNISGIDFYWVKDIGKYQSEQYYEVILHNTVPEFACDRDMSYRNKPSLLHPYPVLSTKTELYQRYLQIGGYLPQLSQLFYDLWVLIPPILPQRLMPDSDFTYVYFESDNYRAEELVVSKRAAEILMQEKVIRQKHLMPCELYVENPKGYSIQKSMVITPPDGFYLEKLRKEYEKWSAIPKLRQIASEQTALKALRRAKGERSEDFAKAIIKKEVSNLANTSFAPLIPYYSISREIVLSDEIILINYDQAKAETDEYANMIAKEELLEDKVFGTVFAKCANGDWVVLTECGSVKRVSHETLSECEAWETLAQFIMDAICE